MRCVAHSERERAGNCHHCGRDFCAECLVDINGERLCKSCVAVLAKAGGRHGHDSGPSYKYKTKLVREKDFNNFFLFILSALPGLGYMYLGLIKRGMFVMSAFFLNIYLLSATRFSVLGFLIPVLFFASFFDGFRIARLIRSGEKVQDGIDDIFGFVKRHKVIIFGGLGVIIALEILSGTFRFLRWGLVFGSNWNLAPIILIGVGAYFLFFRGRTGRRHGHYRHHSGHKSHDGHNNNDENRQQ